VDKRVYQLRRAQTESGRPAGDVTGRRGEGPVHGEGGERSVGKASRTHAAQIGREAFRNLSRVAGCYAPETGTRARAQGGGKVPTYSRPRTLEGRGGQRIGGEKGKQTNQESREVKPNFRQHSRLREKTMGRRRKDTNMDEGGGKDGGHGHVKNVDGKRTENGTAPTARGLGTPSPSRRRVPRQSGGYC